MFGFFKKKQNHITVKGNEVFIDNKGENVGAALEVDVVIYLENAVPGIKVYENLNLI